MANDNDIHMMTNCLSKCNKNAYGSKPIGGVNTISNEDPRLSNTIMVQLYYSSVEHEQREQVNITNKQDLK